MTWRDGRIWNLGLWLSSTPFSVTEVNDRNERREWEKRGI